jgi:hypothetical protein
MFKYICPAILCLPCFAIVVAIPGDQPVLSLLLGFVAGSAGWLIGSELDYRKQR